MHRTPAAAHTSHDELLLARLYGNDLNERERVRALDLIASCRECADLFADLGAIASATVALPTPARPRDFSLTEADAARLRRRAAGSSVFGLIARTRVLGRAMVAVGLAGVVLLGAVSAFLPGTGSGQQPAMPAAAPVGATSGPVGQNSSDGSQVSGPGAFNGGAAGGSPVAAVSSAMPPATAAATAAGATAAAAGPTGTNGLPGELAAASGPGSSGETAQDGLPRAEASGSASKSIHNELGPASATSGPDLRVAALVAFGGLLLLGLLLIVATRISARRSSI